MPNWLVPANVHAVFTTRAGGFSEGPFAGLNVGLHVGDERALVLKNRQVVALKLPVEPAWLDQVHSNRCLLIGSSAVDDNKADAAVTDQKNRVLAVMVADWARGSRDSCRLEGPRQWRHRQHPEKPAG